MITGASLSTPNKLHLLRFKSHRPEYDTIQRWLPFRSDNLAMASSPPSSSQPLLQEHHDEGEHHYNEHQRATLPPNRRTRFRRLYAICKLSVQDFLSSKAQHYTVLGLVSFDLLGIFADIIINLYQCDEKDTDPHWNDVRLGLGIAGLVFSCVFLLELILSVWAFGWRYFNSWFHCFDAAVIVAGFIVDVLLHGILEEVASLVIVLRLWRFFKIIEEFSVGAEEQLDQLELKIQKLVDENTDLRMQLKKQQGTLDEEAGLQSRGSNSGK